MVRLSGAGIRERLQPLLVPPLAGWSRRPRAVTLSWDPSEPPVPAVLLLFPAGGSYTGEESAEIYLPSAPPRVRNRRASASTSAG
ncbi:MAG: tRNA uridine-5-carboxymethylaminomethyl(34) synthesis GTPase MnmE, partial [Planctomycetota bacterium]